MHRFVSQAVPAVAIKVDPYRYAMVKSDREPGVIWHTLVLPDLCFGPDLSRLVCEYAR